MLRNLSTCNRAFGLLFFAAVWLIVSPRVAEACSCVVSEPADYYLENSKNVFVLRVDEVSKPTQSSKYLVRTTVERVFKGGLRTGTELEFGYEGDVVTSCDWMFSEDDIGKEFLFYRDEVDPHSKLVGMLCNREGPVSRFAADIPFLEDHFKFKGKSRVAGVVTRRLLGEKRLAPFEGLELRIDGNGISTKLVTDKNGVYEKYDLPPGEYTVTASAVDGYSSSYLDNPGGWKVKIESRKHTEANFWFEIANEISGRIVDRSGNGMEGVCLKLESLAMKPSTRLSTECTDRDGAFEFNRLYDKSFRLVVNPEDKVTSGAPFEKFYYPNTKIVDEATIFNLGPGIEIKDLLITPSEMVEIIVVTGRVVYADGKPAVRKSVGFFGEKDGKVPEFSEENTYTDKAGNFRLQLLKGKRGQILAQFYGYVSKGSKCKKLRKLVEENEVRSVRTPPISIETESDLFGVELRFPFPKCEELDE